jgi:hypothetical protein
VLKYYKEENERYGTMGSITVETAELALQKAYHRFNLPRVKFVVNKRKRNWSHYKAGLNMYRPLGRLAPAIGVPTIEMAPSMMTWATVLHELGHHVHTVRFNDAVVKKAIAAGVKVFDTTTGGRRDFQIWGIKNVKREHVHGATHRRIMQELVDFFLSEGMITVKPTYLQMAPTETPAATAT